MNISFEKFNMHIIKQFFVNLYSRISDFCKASLEVSASPRSKITGCILSLALIIFIGIFNRQFTSQNFNAKWLILGSCMLLSLLIGVFTAFKIKIKNKILNVAWMVTLFLTMPFIMITMTEALNGIFIYDMTPNGLLGNYCVILVLIVFLYAISGSFRLASLILTPVMFGLGVAHAYLMQFRGTPFIPMDFFSVTTAAKVANTYNYTPTYNMIAATIVFVLIIVIAVKSDMPETKAIYKIVSRAFFGTITCVLLSVFYFTNIFADAGLKPNFWNQTSGYKNYGFVYNFFCNTKYLYMTEPSGYDSNQIGDNVDKIVGDYNKYQDGTLQPNIICIMNESLSDLGVLGEFETNQDYMPFMHSLTENTIKGNLFVPVIGGGTSNTEFEFLTGHSTAFLPSGSNAYMLYVKNPMASLVSTLEAQGYSSIAIHPYYSSGWDRASVYDNFGFNKFISLENMMDISLMDDYASNGKTPDYLQELLDQYYPGKNMIIRQYISDSYNYKQVIEDYNNRDKSKPYFAFNVTMQNHGGYNTPECSNFEEEIYLTSVNGNYPKTNKYLSLVKKSDDAFKELIEHFQKVKEPTVICMFGDHQPSVEASFVNEMLGVSDIANITIEQNQKRHTTPFFIWANYDIEEQYIERLSVNYLSSYVLQTAGVYLTEYNKYLVKLSEILPVIDTVGYIDIEGNYYSWGNKSKYTDLLNEYERIQYNNVFDSEKRNNKVFYLEGYVYESSNLVEAHKDD